MFMVRYVGTNNHRGSGLVCNQGERESSPRLPASARRASATGTVVKRMVGAMDASLSESEGK